MCLQLVSLMSIFKLRMLCTGVRRRHCGVLWTVLAICSHDQGSLQLLTYGGFPKTGQTPTRDRWCVRVGHFLPPSVGIF